MSTDHTDDRRAEMRKQQLKDILDQLVVDCGEEYKRLHTGKQDFALTDSRMNYYEYEAIKRIAALFPTTEIQKVLITEPHSNDYDTGYNSGYIAGKRAALKSGAAGKEAAQ